MKIAVISSSVFPCPPVGYAGLEYIAYYTAKGLAERGHQVLLLAPDGSQCPGCQVFHTGPIPNQQNQWNEQKAYGGIGKQGEYAGYWQMLPNVDVVIDHSWGKNCYQLKQEGRLKAPILGVCHAPIATMFKSLPNVEHPCMVCISEDQAQSFEGIFNRKAKVCYNGIDLDFYKPLGVPRSDRFLFLARFSHIKGPMLAIDACLKAGVGLDMIGDTSITNEPELLRACKAKADGKQIRLIGPANRGECVWWFSQARALIHAIKYFREPFGLAPVESMACGTPVIAWDNGACRETIDHAISGWLVNSEEALLSAINTVKDGEYWRTREKDCRSQASKFGVQRMAERYETLVLEALNKPW